MPKSTKRFILSNSDLNSHGFRVMTEGLDTSDFEKNPVMFWMHLRADGTMERMPVGFWDDLLKEGDNYTGVPNLDDNDPMSMKLYHKIEHGTIRAASAGVLPVELSDNPKDMLPGQALPSFKRSKIKEASLVDIGSNASAVTLYSPTGQIVSLSAGSLIQHFNDLLTPVSNMKLTTLNAPAVFALLKLDPEKATEADALAEVEKIVTLNVNQAVQITTLSIAKKTAEEELTALRASANEGKITTLVDKAVADRKILPGQKEQFVTLAASNFEVTKALLDSMTGTPTVQGQLNTGGEKAEVAELVKLSWDDLHKSGELATLKAMDMDAYKAKFKSKFKTDYKD